ncbi:hypothetical protein Tco_0923349 [Tanacetum coccineum]|uniref:Uncharacterized protein n=1 Tax=Tanacetum coccineum TaxID=301880 RepID=A0ABQ5D0P9_9ASTR
MEKKDTLSSCSDSEIQQMQLIQDKTKESCMVSFQRLHSHLKCLLNNDLKGSRTEDGFKRAFTTLFCQDLETFTGTMFLNVDQLEKQLDNKEFQEIGSMASFKVLETQFQMFINSQIYLNDEYIVMTRNYFLEYTRLDILEFSDTLILNMDYVKKSIEKRARHKMEYDNRVNERLTQTTEENVDSSKALDASLVIIESNGTTLKEQDTSSRSGNDAHVDDADIRPIYNEEPMAEVQTTAEINVFAIGQQKKQKNLALIAKYFKKIYKPTNNNLGTSSNTRNKNVDTTPRYKNDNQTGQFGKSEQKQKAKYGLETPRIIMKRMLLCKQAEKGVQLQAEQSDWLADTDEEIDKQELEAHYSYMEKIQEVPNADSGTDAEPLEQTEFERYKAFNDRTVDYDKLELCKEKASNVFRKEREQYFEIQDLKAQLQDKNIAISELKKLIDKCKGKSVDTNMIKPYGCSTTKFSTDYKL